MAFWEAFFLLNHKVVWVGGENWRSSRWTLSLWEEYVSLLLNAPSNLALLLAIIWHSKCLWFFFVQPKFALFQFKTVAPWSVTRGLGKKFFFYLVVWLVGVLLLGFLFGLVLFLPHLLYILKNCNKVSWKPFLLQSEWTQYSQIFFIGEMFQNSGHPSSGASLTHLCLPCTAKQVRRGKSTFLTGWTHFFLCSSGYGWLPVL